MRLKTTSRTFGMLPLIFLALHLSPKLMAEPDAKTQFEHCASCHGGKGQGNPAIEAPSIAGLEDWYVEAQLLKFMTGARGAHYKDYAGLRMRPMARHLWNGTPPIKGEREMDEATGAKVKALATFVSKLPVVKTEHLLKGNPLKGETIYNQICVACHGPDAKGMRATQAPSLVHLDDWYMLAQLKKFKSDMRGNNGTLDPMGATMVPMAKLLPDEETMANVISYIKALEGAAEGAE